MFRIRTFLRIPRLAILLGCLLAAIPLMYARVETLITIGALLALVFLAQKLPALRQPSISTVAGIAEAMAKIDWYNFEKFNALILRAEGYEVERRGGAHPDCGIDLVATRDGRVLLVQCKQWQNLPVPEHVIRELIGSMTDFGSCDGAVHSLRPATEPAARLAARHRIEVCDAQVLARRALDHIPQDGLAKLLFDRGHRCPKCESPMILRRSHSGTFWGCSRWPRCDGVIRTTS